MANAVTFDKANPNTPFQSDSKTCPESLPFAAATIQVTPRESSPDADLSGRVTIHTAGDTESEEGRWHISAKEVNNILVFFKNLPWKDKPEFLGERASQAFQIIDWMTKGKAGYNDASLRPDLKFNNVGLSQLPIVIRSFVRLQNLELANNRLTEVPGEVAELPELRSVNLDNNRLETFPVQVLAPKLQEVFLRYNPIKTWPVWLPEVQKERNLVITFEPKTRTALDVCSLIAMFECLDYEKFPPLTSFEERARVIDESIQGRWKEQILAQTKIILFCLSLPAEIRFFKNLTHLNLSLGDLLNLPPEIGELSKLQELNLARNKLEVLPTEIGELTSLITLDLRSNKLRSLPDLENLDKLEVLDVSENQLTAFAPNRLESLRVLNVRGNRLNTNAFNGKAFPALQTLIE